MSEKPFECAFISLQEAAKYLKIHDMTCYRLVKQRKLPAIKLGGHYKFRKDILEKFLLHDVKWSIKHNKSKK